MHLSSIHVYPLKGARGIALSVASVRREGIRHDRRFMVLGADGGVLTQREQPRLALVETRIEGAALALSTRGPSGLEARLPLVDPPARSAARRRVRVWGDEVDAREVGSDAAIELLSRHLGERCTLVYVPDDALRQVDRAYAEDGDRVAGADGFPLLVATRASLAEVEARVGRPVPMNRFRPNLVIEGAAPWDEEKHPRVRIGSLTLRMPKRCARCAVPTVDQETADVGKEPLATLASFRRDGNNVYFAMNAIPDAEAGIAVGDPVEWLET